MAIDKKKTDLGIPYLYRRVERLLQWVPMAMLLTKVLCNFILEEVNSTIATARWVQVGDDIDGAAIHDHSGYSVSLSSDGKAVAIGSPYADDNGYTAGHVRVFHLEEEPECSVRIILIHTELAPELL